MHATAGPAGLRQQHTRLASQRSRAAVSVLCSGAANKHAKSHDPAVVRTRSTVRQSKSHHRADKEDSSINSKVLRQQGSVGPASLVRSFDNSADLGATGRNTRNKQHDRLKASKGIDAKLLTAYVKRTTDLQQLVQLVQQHSHQFDYIHTASAFTQLGQWQRKQQLTADNGPAVAQLLHQLEQLMLSQHHLQHCKPRQLSNIIWACSLLGYTSTAMYALCLQEFCAKLLAVSNLQDVSNILYGLAESGQQMQQSMLERLLAVSVQPAILDNSVPQNIANTIWSVAKLEQCIPQAQLQLLVSCLSKKTAELTPQDISNTVWGIATMGANISWQTLQQLETAFVGQVTKAKPVELSNFLWACAVMQYYPQQLFLMLRKHDLCQKLLSAMKPQELANVGFALGTLGVASEQLMAQVLHQSLQLLDAAQDTSSSRAGAIFKVQELCNLCWSVAVLDLQQQIPEAIGLLRACAQQYHSASGVDMRQIHQVQLWLQDTSGTNITELNGVFSPEQLEECKLLWVGYLQQLSKEVGPFFQSEVFGVLQQLQLHWRVAPVMEQPSNPDGMFSIDISGTTATGLQVAIEVDGPSHFRRPDYGLTGSTLYRNRALAARGYLVVSVPVYAWQRLQSIDEKQQYLMSLLGQALKEAENSRSEQQAPAAGVRVPQRGHITRQKSPHQAHAPSPDQLLQQQFVALSTSAGRVRRVRQRQAPSA